MADKELFGISEQLDCSDCVNHGGDWNCDHVHCRKGTDTISRRAALKGLEDLNIASFYELDEHSKEAYTEVKAMLKALPSAQPSPCDMCRYAPPSSMDGKPCAVCPAEGR